MIPKAAASHGTAGHVSIATPVLTLRMEDATAYSNASTEDATAYSNARGNVERKRRRGRGKGGGCSEGDGRVTAVQLDWKVRSRYTRNSKTRNHICMPADAAQSGATATFLAQFAPEMWVSVFVFCAIPARSVGACLRICAAVLV
eukprot:3899976-Rhodomonas_salina.1